jgi:hypothetical protein
MRLRGLAKNSITFSETPLVLPLATLQKFWSVAAELAEGVEAVGSARIQRGQGAGVLIGRVLEVFGGRQAANGQPQVTTLPVLAAFAVQRAIQAIEGIGQRGIARGHIGQGFWLLSGPGIEGVTGG